MKAVEVVNATKRQKKLDSKSKIPETAKSRVSRGLDSGEHIMSTIFYVEG